MPKRESAEGSRAVPGQPVRPQRGSLLYDASSLRSLNRAYRELRKRPDSKGSDDVTIREFGEHLNANLLLIRRRLRAGAYRFQPLRPVAISKKAGFRPILVPSVADRVVQRAIMNAISPSVDPLISSPHSHAFRSGRLRGVPSAVQDLSGLLRHGSPVVLLADIVEFFPSVDPQRLFAELSAVLPDQSLGPLLFQLRDWEIDDLASLPENKRGCFPAPKTGLPQGSILSPMLANFYLRELDNSALRTGIAAVRYADDIAVATTSREAAARAFEWLRTSLAPWGLRLHDLGTSKSTIVDARSRPFDYLGCVIQLRGSDVRVRPSRRAIDNACFTIREILSPRARDPLARRYRRLSFFVEGWLAAFRKVCLVREARRELIEEAQTGLENLLRERKLLRPGSRLTVKQRAFLNVDSVFSAVDAT